MFVKGIDTLLRKKRHYFLIQFPNTCYVIHVHNDTYHLFDPYGRPGKGKKRKPMKAGWTKYKNVNKLKRKIRKDALKGAETYAFYNFEILSIKKAPKKIVLGQRMAEYEKSKEKREEHIGEGVLLLVVIGKLIKKFQLVKSSSKTKHGWKWIQYPGLDSKLNQRKPRLGMNGQQKYPICTRFTEQSTKPPPNSKKKLAENKLWPTWWSP